MTITFSWTLIEQYYDHCPEKARQVHVLKTAKDVYTPKIAGGINTHQAIDNHIRKHDLLPSSLEWLKPYIDAFRQGGVAMTEKQWAVDRWLNGCSFFADKNGRDPWIRGKWDLAVKNGSKGLLVDWKDGKEWEKDGQLELGAMLWMANDPEIMAVTGVNFWLQERKFTKEPYVTTREDLSPLWGQKWLKKMREIEAKDARGEWEKRPVGWRCRNCPVVSCGHNPRYGQ
jgi:hypothetical protein